MNKRKRNTSIFYGWFIVFIAGLGTFFSGPGQTYSNSTFIEEYIKSFGWNRTEISSLYSIATLCSGFLIMFMGKFMDRFGYRRMLGIVSVLFSLACFFNSFVTNIWMLGIGFFLIRFLGQGSMTLIPNTIVPQWFIKKRGRAMSFMAIGSFSSAAFFPIANTWLIDKWDWQTTWQIWGVALLIIFTPLAIIGVRNRPEDIGALPDGITEKFKNKSHNKISHSYLVMDWTLKEAMQTKAFWAILVCVGIPALVNTAITFHLLSIFQEQHLSSQLAASVLSLMALVGFPISFLSGFILEKIQTKILLMGIFLTEITFLILLINVKSIWIGIIFGILWGASNGIERITLNIIWSDYFGRKYLGSINGIAMMVMVVGSAIGPLPLGIGYDYFHSYIESLLFLLLFPILGIFGAILAKKPQKVTIAKRAN
ncbi:MFS transporter [Niallia sp. MER TA 168]|uniref:MFS transporter n=1 Tax=Niallia sp. MER TA 168 TaxID=2939568 RepID=UPI00203C7EF2|nr:MFS transporter [Niallia sp. MER TA 168]MCM3362614.1 MFS transporter [Niallia sp. MER TA 168]